MKQPDDKIKRVPNDRWNKGKRWLSCWTDPAGQERTKAFQKKAAADDYWKAQEADVLRGDYIDPNLAKKIFGHYAKIWLDTRQVDLTTDSRYRETYKLHVEDKFSHRPVGAIKPTEIQGFIVKKEKTLGESVMNLIRHIIQGTLALAEADEAIRKNPARSPIVKVSRTEREKIVAWPDDRVSGIIDAHPKNYRLVPTLGAATGQRENELFAIGLDDFDFENGLIHIRRQLKYIRKRGWIFALPKNDKARIVPMDDLLAQAVQAHIKQYPPRPYCLPWEDPDGKTIAVNILFRSDTTDKHINYRVYSEYTWKPALACAEVIPKPTIGQRNRPVYATTGKEGLHQLRHYYACIMLAGGATINEVAEFLGHADPGFTLKVYGHMMPESYDRARRIIRERMFRPRLVAVNE